MCHVAVIDLDFAGDRTDLVEALGDKLAQPEIKESRRIAVDSGEPGCLPRGRSSHEALEQPFGLLIGQSRSLQPHRLSVMKNFSASGVLRLVRFAHAWPARARSAVIARE